MGGNPVEIVAHICEELYVVYSTVGKTRVKYVFWVFRFNWCHPCPIGMNCQCSGPLRGGGVVLPRGLQTFKGPHEAFIFMVFDFIFTLFLILSLPIALSERLGGNQNGCSLWVWFLQLPVTSFPSSGQLMWFPQMYHLWHGTMRKYCRVCFRQLVPFSVVTVDGSQFVSTH